MEDAVLPEARLSSLDTRGGARRRGQNWRSEIWSDKLRYREAPEVTLEDDCVVFDGVSQIGPGELRVTAQNVVEQTR